MKHLLIILPCLFFPAIGCLGCSHEEPGQNPDKEIPAPPGIVVNHVPKSTETYIGSPSLCILPNGDYIASHDLFGPKANTGKMGTTLVFRSGNKGATWEQIARIGGQYWSNLFLHREDLYLLGTDKGHGNIVIRRSKDGGRTWSVPMDAATGVLFEGHYLSVPTPVALHNGRLWRAFENADALDSKLPDRYGILMISAPADGDLLDAANWKMTNFLVADDTWMNGQFRGWYESNALTTRDGRLVDIARVHIWPGAEEMAAIAKVSADGEELYFQPSSGFVRMPGGSKKFTIRYDKNTGRYWSLVNNIPAGYENAYPATVRNYLAVISSGDLLTWKMHRIVLEHPDRLLHGFQYVDWLFEGDDIVFLSRTAFDDEEGGAVRYHDANFLTFHRIENYKSLLTTEIEY